jgi:DNA segregation ATPase FtsK/SpoIIIE-like protein
VGTYKTSNTRKKESTSKKTRTQSGRSSKKTSGRIPRKSSIAKQRVKEVTEQISILEVFTESASAAKPFLLVFCALFCLYTGLALFSFQPSDLEVLVEGNVQNLCGVFGVILSKSLFLFLGYGAWVILPIGGLFAWTAAGRPLLSWIKMSASILFFWTILCFLSLLFSEVNHLGFYAGGSIGQQSILFMSKLIGPGGAWIMLTGMSVSLIIFIAGMELNEIVEGSLQRLEEQGPSIGKRYLNWGQETFSRMKEFSWDMKDSIAERFSKSEWDEDDDWYDDYTFTDSGSCYTDDGMEYEDEDSLPPSVFEQEYSEDYSYDTQELPSDVDHTHTRVQNNVLAEAEWDGKIDDSSFSSFRSQINENVDDSPATNPSVKKISKKEVARGSKGDSKSYDIPSFATEDDCLSKLNYNNIDNPPTKSMSEFLDVKEELDSVQEEIDLPDESWDEDLSEWYVETADSTLPPVRKKQKALPELKSDKAIVTSKKKTKSVSQLKEEKPPTKKKVKEQVDTPSTSSSKKVSAVKKSVQLPFREVTPVEPVQLQMSEEQEEFTPARVSLNPGNLDSGGQGEVDLLHNPYHDFALPSLKLLDLHAKESASFDEAYLVELAEKLVEKLSDFGVKGEVETICPGPVITTFEFKPARGVKISKISNLSDDIAMALKAIRVRIVAPIPGKDVVGIEIPNIERKVIWSRDMLGSKVFQEHKGTLPLALGKTVDGLPYVTDLAKMPHLLVGGTTGSGKSVGINTMIVSMLLRHSPETLRLILIDPKMLEFEMYHDIPHLIHPVVTEPKLASAILQWACIEMDKRYALMAKFKTRTIDSYNKRLAEELNDWSADKATYYAPDSWDGKSTPPMPKKMPYIVVVIDELADLMMVADKEVETSIIRLAQKARACGIHLIVATQRPSVDVITGMIKANMPCRISFQVRSRIDSRTILDQSGGETLLGKGDMLFIPPGVSNVLRCHGPFLSDDEVRRVTDHLRSEGKPNYEAKVVVSDSDSNVDDDEYDALYDQAVEFICEKGKASTSMIQRRFRIGYNRAARIIDIMEREGIVGPSQGAKQRQVLLKPME